MTWTRRFVLGLLAETGVATVVGSGRLAAPDPTRHVVGTDPGAADAARRSANAVSGVLSFGSIGSAVIGQWSPEDLDALRATETVRYVEPETTVYALEQQRPCGVERIDADHVRDDGTTGAGTDTAIIDSGIDSNHPDLQANLGEGATWEDCSGENCAERWDDDYGHGTAVAGLVGAEHNSRGVVGVAPDTTLHAAKVLDEDGTGSSSDVAAAIKWTADRGYDVANLSIGSPGSTEVIGDAVRYAAERGVLLVGAAGNRGPCSDCVIYPAAREEVIAVSAVDCGGEWESYSSEGDAVEVAGVAGSTTTVGDGYSSFTGTSAATSHVSGVGALLLASGRSAAEARDRMNETAENLGLSASRQGNGLVNADKAVLGTEYDGGGGSDGGGGGDGGGGSDGGDSGDGGGGGGDGSSGDDNDDGDDDSDDLLGGGITRSNDGSDDEGDDDSDDLMGGDHTPGV